MGSCPRECVPISRNVNKVINRRIDVIEGDYHDQLGQSLSRSFKDKYNLLRQESQSEASLGRGHKQRGMKYKTWVFLEDKGEDL